MKTLLALIAFANLSQPVTTRSFGTAVKVCDLATTAINESSGLAPSFLQSGKYYTHNDSGDTARFFKFDLTGVVLAAYSLQGVTATDWEDMDSATFGGNSYVYLGDIGDNNSNRNSIKIYKVQEPTTGGATLSNFETYTVTYPDGPKNCETLMVHPKTGDIWLVTKTDGPSIIYKLPKPSASGTFVLKRMGSFTFGSIVPTSARTTGGSIAPDGRHVVIRTYFGAFEFLADPKNFDRWMERAKPMRVTTRAEGQGEAICYSTDGRALLTSSEGNPCPITKIPITLETTRR